MRTLIFRTCAPLIVATMLVFSLYICLRGHNEPGGGFIGGLIAAAAMGVFAMAAGVTATRRALRVDPLAIAGFGLFIAGLSGVLSLFTGSAFMTSIWLYLGAGEGAVALSTPLVFDLGVYCVVFGTLSGVLLALEDGRGEEL